ncbi:hypothetical protein K438DRAFT_1770583 [Mycena galopus ATCC 62051]|nr:hypothetical protein K438DRAFT_1770583 [Mycena galopus ATCC 62051]
MMVIGWALAGWSHRVDSIFCWSYECYKIQGGNRVWPAQEPQRRYNGKCPGTEDQQYWRWFPQEYLRINNTFPPTGGACKLEAQICAPPTGSIHIASRCVHLGRWALESRTAENRASAFVPNSKGAVQAPSP